MHMESIRASVLDCGIDNNGICHNDRSYIFSRSCVSAELKCLATDLRARDVKNTARSQEARCVESPAKTIDAGGHLWQPLAGRRALLTWPVWWKGIS
jgi:hypothetical protein